MKTSPILIGPLLQSFFAEHLLTHKRVSHQTIASYRDTFRLLLQFLKQQRNLEPAALPLMEVDAPAVLAFLDNLEQERHCCARSRNTRLAAIRTFFRWVALREPGSVGQASRILAIPVKRTDRKLVQSLTRSEIDALLAAPDIGCRQGRRDHALLLALYNTGARVSEIVALRQEQVEFGKSSYVLLRGKGRKERKVPLWSDTANALKNWFQELSGSATSLAFPSARGTQLTRNGVDYILRQVVSRANCPALAGKRISPHVLRHSTAMHLLQSGVDVSVIALWLGHESIETTHMYVEADLATKEKALQKLTPANASMPRFKASDQLLAFLASL